MGSIEYVLISMFKEWCTCLEERKCRDASLVSGMKDVKKRLSWMDENILEQGRIRNDTKHKGL